MPINVSTSLQWFFACPQFIEPLLANELTHCGADAVKVGHAGVQAMGDLRFGYRAMLWSRLASRATLQLAHGFGKNQAELRTLIDGVDWQQHLRPDGTFKVRFSGLNDDIRNTQFGAQWVKDQIGDQFRSQHGRRPSIDPHPDVTVTVNLHKGKASIGIDLNQHSLCQRGYRGAGTPRLIGENLAAAVLIRSGWLDMINRDATSLALLDPWCDTGTFLIEGALMALDIAPGLLRERTVAQRWLGHDSMLWDELYTEAEERRRAGLANAKRFEFSGNANNLDAMMAARSDWHSIDLPAASWTQGDFKATRVPKATAGLVISHLPFTDKDTVNTLHPLYNALGKWMAGLPETYQGALFTNSIAPLALTDLFYTKEYRFLNRETEFKLYTFDTIIQKERPAVGIAEDLANRLTKNLRKLKGFIKQGHTNAYRVYDRDIPEYAIAIDRYADWLHVQEYAPPKTVDEKAAEQRLQQALLTLPMALDVDPAKIVLKQRRQQKGNNQYQKQGRAEQALVVIEHGARFRVNLTDYLDTGLFLDHRPMRYWLQQHSHGKRVLNLFCYTGTASVHAAIGGAARVDSVDMSATYLEWAKNNFALNNLQHDPYRRYRFIQANVLDWLYDCDEYYDLIFLDPPTFSNSKRMQETFDVQRDHSALIDAVMRVLSPDGITVFSNNFRKFKLDAALGNRYAIQDYSKSSLPLDFERDPKIHRCWLIKHQ